MIESALAISPDDEEAIARIVALRQRNPPEPLGALIEGVEAPQGEVQSGRPVPNFPIEFTWQAGDLVKLFDRQVELIAEDVTRALQSGRLVVYISCPISSRGGGFAGTNVEIALYTQNRLQDEWGEGFWFLNPAQYQMESKAGTGLILRHARQLEREGVFNFASDDELRAFVQGLKPSGGDYMRMWTRVLVEGDPTVTEPDSAAPLEDRGRFAGFYFVGPSDAAHFFRVSGGQSLAAGAEAYFARKYTMDASFNEYYTPGKLGDAEWRELRARFFRYYTIRYGANYSLGSHDEWNIWRKLNALRLRRMGVGGQVAGYFEGRQIDLSSSETGVSRGYANSD